MLAEVLSAVQQSDLATGLRMSRWVYPGVSAGHVLGLALLFGAILPLDLRLLGLWRSVPMAVLARVLVPVAVTGLAISAATGAMLFSVDAVKYAGAGLFQAKMLLVLGGVTNALLLRRAEPWTARHEVADTTGRLRAAGALSIGLWLAAIVCGRMLGYL